MVIHVSPGDTTADHGQPVPVETAMGLPVCPGAEKLRLSDPGGLNCKNAVREYVQAGVGCWITWLRPTAGSASVASRTEVIVPIKECTSSPSRQNARPRYPGASHVAQEVL